MNRRVAAATLSVLPLIGLVGCSAAASGGATTAPPFIGGEAAQQAAEQTFRHYADAVSDVDYADPETFEPVFAWLEGEYLDGSRQLLEQRHAAGETGRPAIFLVKRFNRVIPGPTTTPPGGTEIGVCYDLSSVRVSDGHGTTTDIPRHEMHSLLVTFAPAGNTATRLKIVRAVDGDPATDCRGA